MSGDTFHSQASPSSWHGSRFTGGLDANKGTPEVVGQIYHATDTKKVYLALGTASSSDWEEIIDYNTGSASTFVGGRWHGNGGWAGEISQSAVAWYAMTTGLIEDYNDGGFTVNTGAGSIAVPSNGKYRIAAVGHWDNDGQAAASVRFAYSTQNPSIVRAPIQNVVAEWVLVDVVDLVEDETIIVQAQQNDYASVWCYVDHFTIERVGDQSAS